jgi:hypothetical protein
MSVPCWKEVLINLTFFYCTCPKGRPKAGRSRFERRQARSTWRLSRPCHFQDLFHLLPGSHGKTGWIRIEGRRARGRWRLTWVGHFKELHFLPFPMGRQGGSGLRGIGPEVGGTSLGWAISRNSIFYMVPMGRQGGSGLRGGGPEASVTSLGWAILWN